MPCSRIGSRCWYSSFPHAIQDCRSLWNACWQPVGRQRKTPPPLVSRGTISPTGSRNVPRLRQGSAKAPRQGDTGLGGEGDNAAGGFPKGCRRRRPPPDVRSWPNGPFSAGYGYIGNTLREPCAPLPRWRLFRLMMLSAYGAVDLWGSRLQRQKETQRNTKKAV